MFTPGSGACAGGASGLIIVALAPGTSAETVRSSRCWSVAVTVAMPKWLATASSPSHPVDVAAGGGELAEGGRGGARRRARLGRRARSAARLGQRRRGRGRRGADLQPRDPPLDARRPGGGGGRERPRRSRGRADGAGGRHPLRRPPGGAGRS